MAIGTAYERLYTNHDGLTDAWGSFWAKVAETFAGAPELLGLELINEPFIGNPYSDPLRLIPDIGDRQRLQPAYDILNSHIRTVAPDALVFFAGCTWDRTGDKIVDALPLGFTHPPGGAEFADRSVSAFHHYGDFCKETNETRSSTSQNAAYGACKTGYGAGPFDGGVLQEDGLRKFARAYAPAIAGNFSSANFDVSSRRFTLEFRLDTSIKAPTVVSTPKMMYPTGFDVSVSPQSALEVTAVDGGLELRAAPDAMFGQVVLVSVESLAVMSWSRWAPVLAAEFRTN